MEGYLHCFVSDKQTQWVKWLPLTEWWYSTSFHTAAMDFIIGLPKSKGKSVIMVVVDRLTKYAYFCALSHPFKASTVATAFMETIQKLHGNPKIIGSDRDPIFHWKFLDIIIFLFGY